MWSAYFRLKRHIPSSKCTFNGCSSSIIYMLLHNTVVLLYYPAYAHVHHEVGDEDCSQFCSIASVLSWKTRATRLHRATPVFPYRSGNLVSAAKCWLKPCPLHESVAASFLIPLTSGRLCLGLKECLGRRSWLCLWLRWVEFLIGGRQYRYRKGGC